MVDLKQKKDEAELKAKVFEHAEKYYKENSIKFEFHIDKNKKSANYFKSGSC